MCVGGGNVDDDNKKEESFQNSMGPTDMSVTCFIKLMDLPALPCTFNKCEPHTNKNHSLNIPLSTHGVKLCGFTIEYRTHLGLCSMMRTFLWYTVKLF